MTTKVCTICGQEKLESCFKKTYGFCKPCMRDRYREKTKEYNREYTASHPDRQEYMKNYLKEYGKTQDGYAKYTKSVDTPEKRLRVKLRIMVNSWFKRGGYKKSSQCAEVLGCTFEELLTHLGIEGTTVPEGYHIDHIFPLARCKNEDEVLRMCHYTNLQLLSARDNLCKSFKITPEGAELCRKLLHRDWEE